MLCPLRPRLRSASLRKLSANAPAEARGGPASSAEGNKAAKNGAVGAAADIESWPLVQAYGIEGVGRPGFFTMAFEVVNIQEPLRARTHPRATTATLLLTYLVDAAEAATRPHV